MMTDDAGFWNAIDAAPGDDLPVLVFADWLDERGDPLGATLRKCVDAGRRPGRFLDGQAFWVTTISTPVANRGCRQGRRVLQPALIRPQPSWLASIYWRYLTGARLAWPGFRSGTVWRYADVESAYRDVNRARADLVKDRLDPDNGRSMFDGLTNSTWRDEALRHIAIALDRLPADADSRVVAAALREAYPFGARKGHPYKMWLIEQRKVLDRFGNIRRRVEPIPAPGGCGWCRGRGCSACAAKRWAAETATAD